MIKNIIFDWSGVLSNDIIPVYKGTMGVFRRLGLKELSFKEYKKEFVLPYMNFYRKFTDTPKEKVDDLFFQEFSLVDGPKPFPKAKKTLEDLKRKGIRIVLLSSHPEEKVKEEMERYNFQDFFVDINSSVHDKVKAIKGILEKNNFIAKETSYLGDMTHDIDAGKSVGVTTVAVCWGYQLKEKLSKKNPDFLIEDLDEIVKILN
ncbi:MAG: HAD family hydrolase [Candidatus Pacebacteria bacterium]|nr:HAD family hydrolase [Candidatus Paceibacterota bacterium]